MLSNLYKTKTRRKNHLFSDIIMLVMFTVLFLVFALKIHNSFNEQDVLSYRIVQGNVQVLKEQKVE